MNIIVDDFYDYTHTILYFMHIILQPLNLIEWKEVIQNFKQ